MSTEELERSGDEFVDSHELMSMAYDNIQSEAKGYSNGVKLITLCTASDAEATK